MEASLETTESAIMVSEPKSSRLLELPIEVRLMILQEVLPAINPVNVGPSLVHHWLCELTVTQLSELPFFWRRSNQYPYDSLNPHFRNRSYWYYYINGKRRCVPPVLSVCKQLFHDVEMLHWYDRTFIINVNCGTEQFARSFEQLFRGERLNGRRIPFAKMKEFVIRIGILSHTLEYPFDTIAHLYDHMVYVCGILLSDAKSIKRLRVEFHTVEQPLPECDDSHGVEGRFGSPFDRFRGCRSFLDLEQSEIRIEHDVEQHGYQLTQAEAIKYLIQPLALPGRVDECKIVLPAEVSDDMELVQLTDRYQRAVTDVEPFSREECQDIWDRYIELIDSRDMRKTRRHWERVALQTAWLKKELANETCKHTGGWGRKYPMNGNSKCEGCDRWYRWLTKCRRCEMRACVPCRKALKAERARTAC